MAVPDLVPRPLVDNNLQPVFQHVNLPGWWSACWPAGCRPRKRSRWLFYHKTRGRTQRSHTFCLGPKNITGLCCVHLSSSSCSTCSNMRQCACIRAQVCVAVQMRSSSSSSSSLLYTAGRALISLVWSSQMEPEHDLFLGETVCFLCPACTKSHIVPLPISHADSPLQVLGYLASGRSDFRSFFS